MATMNPISIWILHHSANWCVCRDFVSSSSPFFFFCYDIEHVIVTTCGTWMFMIRKRANNSHQIIDRQRRKRKRNRERDRERDWKSYKIAVNNYWNHAKLNRRFIDFERCAECTEVYTIQYILRSVRKNSHIILNRNKLELKNNNAMKRMLKI